MSSARFSARQSFRREVVSWSLLAFALAAVEGGVAGVVVRHRFADAVDVFWMGQAVALVAGAPAIANLSSPLWARWEQGRDKVRMVSWLGMALSLSLLLLALSPVSSEGLMLSTGAVLFARFCWSGILTVRSTLWRANYPRYLRAKVTGSIATLMSLVMAATGGLLGVVTEQGMAISAAALVVLALLGGVGAYMYRRLSLRGAESLALQEKAIREKEGQFGVRKFFAILREDRAFRRYMTVMFLFGSGNLMFVAPLILILNDQMDLPAWQQVLLTSSVPLAALPLTIGFWAKMLGRLHVIPYRARHCWSFVTAIGCFALAAGMHWQPLLWVGAFLFGTAVAGAVLGWNLGHHDFATPAKASHYMAVHVTLTGIRGLVMPVVGVNLYHWLQQYHPDSSRWVLLVPLVLSVSGALAFQWLAKRHG
jgi:MFS family permease